jgi:16S rRNA (guanine966-N2)-methyltransferase
MRVIAGEARGRRLRAVPGTGTRPITDRAKEALFSILQADVPGARVLDLFAGTGAVGIEALSRGASWCDFVEQAPAALKTIRANLAGTGLEARARILRRDVFALVAGAPDVPYHLIYVAPPQYHGLWARTLRGLDDRPEWVQPDGLIVVQIHPREDAAVDLRAFAEVDRRRYGGVLLIFYGRREPSPAGALGAPGALC